MSVLILEDNRQILNVLEELVMSVAEDEKVYATDNVGEAYKIAMETSISPLSYFWIVRSDFPNKFASSVWLIPFSFRAVRILSPI